MNCEQLDKDQKRLTNTADDYLRWAYAANYEAHALTQYQCLKSDDKKAKRQACKAAAKYAATMRQVNETRATLGLTQVYGTIDEHGTVHAYDRQE